MNPFLAIRNWLHASPLLYGLRCLSDGSPWLLAQRLGRLRRIAGSLLGTAAKPPLPVRLQIEITDICNLKCRMCAREFMPDMNTGCISMDRFAQLIQDIQPLYVTLNGLGEPLLDKGVFDKLNHLHARNIMTAMPTNGTVLHHERLNQLAQHMPNILTFSLDGATPETYENIRIRGQFSKVINNYKALADRFHRGQTRPGALIRVLTVLQQTNLHDYRPMYQLLAEMHLLNRYSLVPLFDYTPHPTAPHPQIPVAQDLEIFRQQIEQDIHNTVNPEEKKFYRQWRDTAAAWQTQPVPFHSSATPLPCIIPWYNTYVDAKGRVYPCCYLVNTRHIMGHLDQNSFPEIWHGATYQEFRHRLAHDRSRLDGCATCPRDDTKLLNQLKRFSYFLP
ncbi:MAG: radical SAM protein [Magnetococcus sp. DMHC-1]